MKFPFSLTSVTRWLLVVIGCACLATAQPMSAASPEVPEGRKEDTVIYPKTAAGSTSSKDAANETGRPLLIVAAFLLACTGLWVIVQRRKAAGLLGPRGLRQLEIEETRPLGNRQYLLVANYAGRKFLLGVTPGQIQLLTPLEDKTERKSP